MASSRKIGTNENISTYGGGTRDYTSLSAWESDTDYDLVTATTSEVLECYADSASFDDNILLNGATTDSSYFRIIRPASGEGHDGTPNTGVRFFSTTAPNNASVFSVQDNYTQIQDIVVKLTITSSTNHFTFQFFNSGNSAFVGCIAIDSNNLGTGRAEGFAIRNSNATNFVINCLGHNNKSYGIRCFTAGNVRIYNSTFTNNGEYGVRRTAGTCVATNVCSSGNGIADWNGTITQITCTAEGANPTYKDAGNDDFHLASSDTVCKDNATDLSADANYAFDDDIDFQTRNDGNWDIGFDEYFPEAVAEDNAILFGSNF